MIFVILCSLLIQATPGSDSLLAISCQQQGLDTTAACAAFQTIYAAWLEVEDHKNDEGKYSMHTVFYPERLTLNAFEKKFGCTLPASPITDSTYAITIAPSTTVGGDTLTLCISFFRMHGDHQPLVNLRFNPVSKCLHYEYVTPGKEDILEYKLPD